MKNQYFFWQRLTKLNFNTLYNIFKYLDCIVIDDKFYNDKYNDNEIKVVPKSQYKR